MSTQEERFAQIAAAIREKDGTTAPIRALDFAERIRAIQTGGGSCSFAVPLVVTVDAGATVTATHGETTVTATSGADGTATLILTAPGVWGVTAALGDKEKSVEIEVLEGYDTKISLSSRLPEGYTELEYIHLEGNNSIFVLLEAINCYTDRVIYEIYPESYGTSNYNQGIINFYSKIGSTYYYINCLSAGSNILKYALNNNQVNSQKTIPTQNLVTFDFDFRSNTYTVNGETLIGTRSNRLVGTGARWLGASTSVKGKTYKFLHYRDDDIIHEYVPCMDSDGVCGLFDVNTETFIKNTHSTPTPVTPGPAV